MRIVVALHMVILLAVSSSHAQDDCLRPEPTVWASADVLSWKAHSRGLDFAVTEDGSALTVGAGRVHDVGFEREAGFRANVGIRPAVGWGVEFAFTHFGTEGSTTVERPPGTGQLFSSFSHPGGPDEADIAIGSAALDYDVFDMVVSYSLVNNRFVGVDLFGGLRWADISQRLESQFDGRAFDNGEVTNESDVNAFGFRFGGQSRCRLGHGVSLLGGVSVAALYGNIDNHRYEADFGGAQVLVDIQDSYVQPVFNLDTSLGAGWTHKNWFLSAGYELNIWTNLGDSLRFVDDIEVGSIAGLSGDLLLEGFFFRVTKAW